MKIRILFTVAIFAPVWFITPVKAENPEHVKQLLETKQCQGCDLSGANLSNANLEGANLSGANLREAVLVGANLTNANLQRANLTRANLTNAKLTNVNLNDANLTSATGLVNREALAERGAEGRVSGSASSIKFRPPTGLRPPDIREVARLEGGATRGGSFWRGQPPTALLPDSGTGLTVAEYPTIFVYVPLLEVPRTTVRTAEFVLRDEKGNQVYATTFTLPDTEGIVSISIPATGTLTPLKIGKEYGWNFLLIPDPDDRAQNSLVEGSIKRVPLSPTLVRELQKASPNDRPAMYAEAGIWYETLTTLAELRRANPNDATLANQWKDLLRSVGLNRIAEKNLLESLPISNQSRGKLLGTEGQADRPEGAGVRAPDVRLQGRPSPILPRQPGGFSSPDIRESPRRQPGGSR